MKHDGPLYQREVSPLIERFLVAKVINMINVQLMPFASLDRKLFQLRINAKFDEVSDC